MSIVSKTIAAAGVCLVLLPSAALAQNGSIAGVVRDTSGGVLPGVTVEASSPVLIEKVRSVVSDSQGQYRIIDLRPGTYLVTFTLPGFSVVRREGIELTAGFTATVNADLRVGALEETITVSGQSPLIDTQSVTQQKALSSEVIDALPTGRSFRNLGVLIPSVSVPLSQTDVGGSNNDRWQTMSVHGSRSDQMPLVLNGMPYNNMNNTGGGYNTTLVMNIGTVQEMTITTSGLSAESRTSGVLADTIPKEGGNSYRGYFFGNYANEHFQADNLSQDLIDQGLLAVGNAYKFWDFNPAGGGPIVQDKLWFYGGFRYSGTQSYVAGGFHTKDPYANQYCADTNGCLYKGVLVPDSRDLTHQAIAGDTWNRGETLNLTWQATPRTKATIYGHFNQRLVDCNSCSATRSPEASTYFTHRPEYLLQGTWSSPVTSRLLLDAGFTFYNERWIFGPQPDFPSGYGPDALIYKRESTNGQIYGAAPTYTTAGNHQYNMRFAVNYVTGSHAFKVGLTDLWGTRRYRYDTNQAQRWNLRNGAPTSIVQYARPLEDTEHLKAELGLFAQDRWTIQNVTLNLGLRFDYHNAYVPEQNIPAIPFVAARHYDPIYDVPNWKDLTYRTGVAWDIFGTGQTVARVNFGSYLAAESVATATANNPLNTSINTASRGWLDANNDFVPDCDLANVAANGECGALSQPLGALNIVTEFDPAMLRGWGVRPNDHEIAVGVQHGITREIAVDVQYTNHWFGNFFATQNRAYPPSSYDPFCVTAPMDSRLPGGGGYQVCDNYDVKPEAFGALNDNLITRAENFGNMTDRFQGIDVNVTGRFAGGGRISGGMSTGHEVTDVCDVINQANPGSSTSSAGDIGGGVGYPSTRWCVTSPPFFQPTWKVNGSYPLPWGGIMASTAISSRPGPQILANWTVTADQSDLGRPFTLRTSTIALIQPGTVYGDRVNQVDIRVTKTFEAGQARIRPSLDIYNALNANPVLTLNSTFGSSWQRPTSIMPGRLVKVGVQIDY